MLLLVHNRNHSKRDNFQVSARGPLFLRIMIDTFDNAMKRPPPIPSTESNHFGHGIGEGYTAR